MNVSIGISSAEQLTDLTSLEDWLRSEADLRSCRFTRVDSATAPDEMGALSDVLIVALGTGGLGTAFATSLSVWLRTRVGKISVRIKTELGEVDVQAERAEDVEQLAASITKIIGSSGVGST